jgi:hypothetical protein
MGRVDRVAPRRFQDQQVTVWDSVELSAHLPAATIPSLPHGQPGRPH